MDEQRCDLVQVMEHRAISPSNDSAGQGSMRQTVTRYPQMCAGREDPKEQKVEDVRVVTQVE